MRFIIDTKSLSDPPNPPPPFPEKEGGDIRKTPLSFQGRAGEGFKYLRLIFHFFLAQIFSDVFNRMLFFYCRRKRIGS